MNGKDIKILLSAWATLLIMGAGIFFVSNLADGTLPNIVVVWQGFSVKVDLLVVAVVVLAAIGALIYLAVRKRKRN
jgi:hypothetical protein